MKLPFLWSFVLVSTVMLSSLLAPSLALACACCDGGNERVFMGWSDRGAALVEAQGFNCQSSHALEIWRLGATAPIACFDLNTSEPNARVSCDELDDGFDMRDTERADRLASSARTRFFPRAVTQLSSDFVRAQVTLLPSGDNTYETPARLTVEVRGLSGWQPLLTKRISLGAQEHNEYEELRQRNPIEVSVFPTPDQTRALVRYSGHNTAPGMGHFPQDLQPVQLPSMDPQAFVSAGPVLQAQPPLTDGTVDRAMARTMNRRGLRLHRAGSFEHAAREFSAAIMHDSADAIFRFNLACAYARLGLPDSALSILESLKGAGSECSRCSSALSRVRTDQDFAGLRDQPRFQSLFER